MDIRFSQPYFYNSTLSLPQLLPLDNTFSVLTFIRVSNFSQYVNTLSIVILYFCNNA